jgi:hypothetical protein
MSHDIATLEAMIRSLENENRRLRETLRDRYVCAVITGLLATGHHYKTEATVDNAFHIADQMLTRRNSA